MDSPYQTFPAMLPNDAMRQLDTDLAKAGRGFAMMQIAAGALLDSVMRVLRKGSFDIPVQLRPGPTRKLPAGWNTRPVLILAGKGNNGGDGILLALKLLTQKIPCTLALVQAPEAYRNEAAQAMKLFLESGAKPIVLDANADLPFRIQDVGLVVDALFGRGFHGELTGIEARLALWLQESALPVFAVDLPSGLAIRADWTLILGSPDPSAALESPGDIYGQWDVHHLGIPQEFYSRYRKEDTLVYLQASRVARLLPSRNPWLDKKGQGILGVMAGSRGMTGAAVLCCQSAMRCGAGMVHLAGPAGELSGLSAQLVEVVIHPQDSVNGTLQASALAGTLSMLTRAHAACIGPGLSTLNEVQKLVRQLALEMTVPLVIDADGLNAFRGYAAMLRGLKETAILTPHDAEWERLFRSPAGQGEERVAALRANCKEYGCVIVLKGAPTLVGTPNGEVFVLPVANSGLAKAGSGDVLAGLISSFRAQGAGAIEAALLGVWVHARAGYLLATTKGARGMLPTDLIEMIPDVLLELENL